MAARTPVSPAPRVANLSAYKVPRHPAPIDLFLDGNEGRGPGDFLARTLAEAPIDVLRRYPSPSTLEAKIAGRVGVDPGRVIVTAGGDDAIDRLCRSLLSPGRKLVLPVPTFEMIAHYARLSGGDVVAVPWPRDRYPVDEVLAAIDDDTALVAVVSPNNPTGQVATPDQLSRIIEGARGALVLVDLAYVEFGDPALLEVALSHDNTLVLRTLSKAWGLAGLRVGYAVGPERVIGWMRAAGAPYAVSGPSLLLASRWLDEGEREMAGFVAEVRREREALSATLSSLGAEVTPSDANFVFARGVDSLWLRDAMASLGIGIRAFPGKPGLEDAVRITVPGDQASFARVDHGVAAALSPEVLLLDMDGVLADASGSYRRAIIETCGRFGVEVTAHDVAVIKQEGDANNDWVVTHRLLGRRGVSASFDEVRDVFEALYHGEAGREGLSATERLLCEKGLLERLSARMPIGIVTGRPRRDYDEFVERFGLSAYISAAVTMHEAPAKPDPAPVRLALERLGKRRAWMVGDTVDDVRAARAAGVVPVGVVAPGDDRAEVTARLLSAGAARVIGSIDEIEAMLGVKR